MCPVLQAGHLLVACFSISLIGSGGFRRRCRYAEQYAALYQLPSPGPVRQKAKLPDTHESTGQNMQQKRGEYEEAEKKYQEAEAIYRNNRLDGGVITCLRARGDLYKRQRKFDEAQKQYGEALNFARDAKDAQAEANLLLGLGDLYIDTKQ